MRPRLTDRNNSDPSPFQWLADQSLSCENVVFVDIDYPDLIARKARIILETPQLLSLLGPPATPKNEEITPLRTKNYITLGCNLANTADLNDALMNEINLESSRVLCLAEISITYMDTAASDSLIKWAGLLPDGKLNRPLSIFRHDITDLPKLVFAC